MPIEEKTRFVLNLKLKTEKWQEDIMNKRFDIARNIYNALLGILSGRHFEMIKTNAWRNNQKSLSAVYTKY